MSDLCKNMTIRDSTKNSKTLRFAETASGPKLLRQNTIKRNFLERKDNNSKEAEALEERIKKREKEEAKKERELILNGKKQPTPAQIRSDKILQIYERVKFLDQKSKEASAMKKKYNKKTTAKWKTAVSKLNLETQSSPFKSVPMFPDGFAYNRYKKSDKLNDKSIADVDIDSSKVYSNNPIHKSFASAKNVDDLYKLADYWLSPTR